MSLPTYCEYKDSGVSWIGDVPAHWTTARYKEIFEERDERSVDGSETLLSVSAYTGVSPRAEIIEDGDHLSRAESLEGYKVCYPNDLVMNIMLAWNRGLGFSSLHGIVSPAYSVFKLRSVGNPRFLDYLVRDDRTTLYFKAYSAGVIESRLRLYPDVFGSLYCSLPPESEQTAIATFLDRETAKIDTLISEQEKLLTLLAEKRQATISHTVTKGLNPDAPMKDSRLEWAGVIPEDWVVSRLGLFASIENGTTPSRLNEDYWTNGEVPWLASGEVNQLYICEATEFITDKALKECSLRLLPVGTIIVGMIGQGRTRGMSAMLSIAACINQNLAAICPGPSLDSKYVLYVFHAVYEWLREAGRGGNQAAMNCQILSALRIPVPPLTEQTAIAAFIDSEIAKLDSLKDECERAVSLLKERRSALIAAAVTGQIDVRDLVTEPEAA